jgi:hypothetical protein
VSESPLDWAEASDDGDDAGSRRRQLMVGGGIVGVALLAGGAFLLLHGGGSSSSNNVVPHGHPRAGVAAPVAVASSPAAVPQVFHGAVGHDPFEVPARIVDALTAAPAAPAVPASSTTPGSVTVPGTTITVPTGSSTTGTDTGQTPTTVKPVRAGVQWIQLLAAHNVGGHWLVDVRTENGVFKDVKAGASKVGGTYFSYFGEDGSLSKPSFVFVVGDSSGGNLIPNSKVKPFTGRLTSSILNSTLVLRNGVVDGGAS